MLESNLLFFYNGATGSLGRYLGPVLETTGYKNTYLLARLEDQGTLQLELERAIQQTGKPKRAVLLQLASLVSVPACEKDPTMAFTTNVTSVAATVETFIETAREQDCSPEVLYVSSGHLYAPKVAGKIHENDPLFPRSVYARTKLQAEEALSSICGREGIRLTIARVFGLIAPEQPENYVLQGLIRRAFNKELSGIPGLDNERDYLDSRDVCRILVKLMTREATGIEIVNVCSGNAVTIRELISLCIEEIYGMDRSLEFQRLLTAGASRPDDIQSIVGDPSRCQNLVQSVLQEIPVRDTIREAIHLSKGRMQKRS